MVWKGNDLSQEAIETFTASEIYLFQVLDEANKSKPEANKDIFINHEEN